MVRLYHIEPVCPTPLGGYIVVTPDSNSYDEVFLGMFSASFHPTRFGMSNDVIQEVLGRIARYEGRPQLAERILADQLVMRRITASDDEGEKDVLVHEAVAEQLKLLEEENQTLRGSVDTKEKAIEQLDGSLQEVRKNLARAHQEIISTQKERDQTAFETDLRSTQQLAELEKLKSKNRFLCITLAVVSIVIGGILSWTFWRVPPFVALILLVGTCILSWKFWPIMSYAWRLFDIVVLLGLFNLVAHLAGLRGVGTQLGTALLIIPAVDTILRALDIPEATQSLKAESNQYNGPRK